jgi:L-cysteine/cystine lyase
MTDHSSLSSSAEEWRQRFLALEGKSYFNYGGQGPLPKVALQAIQQGFEQIQQLGPFSSQANAWIFEEADRTRQAIAQELTAPPTTITLTEDVSVGCNIALWGIDWRFGDHLLTSNCEHPGVMAAVKELQRRFGVEVSICPLQTTLNGGDPLAAIVDQLRPTTRLVVLSHILWNTGQVLPLREIVAACHGYRRDRPVRVLIDAAQSVGVLPLNLPETQVDFYAFTGHKWWCGPAGVGGLYVSPAAQAELHPTFIGWRNITTDHTGNPTGWKPDGRRYEIATSAYPLYLGLREAIALHHQFDTTANRFQRIQTLSRFLWQKLRQLAGVNCLNTSPPPAGLVAFQLATQSHGALVEFLEARQFMVRTILSPNCVRVCIHYFSLESELEQLVAAIAEFMTQSEQRPSTP